LGGYDITKCSECGEQWTVNETEPLGHNHKFYETIAPKCETCGHDLWKCTRCEDSYQINEVPATDHNYSLAETKTATCTQNGYSLYTCDNCGKSYSSSMEKLGHFFVKGICIDCGIYESDVAFDVDLDCKLSANDFTALIDALLNKSSLECDPNNDGKVDILDLVALKKHFATK